MRSSKQKKTKVPAELRGHFDMIYDVGMLEKKKKKKEEV